jgi:hypothetical protein
MKLKTYHFVNDAGHDYYTVDVLSDGGRCLGHPNQSWQDTYIPDGGNKPHYSDGSSAHHSAAMFQSESAALRAGRQLAEYLELNKGLQYKLSSVATRNYTPIATHDYTPRGFTGDLDVLVAEDGGKQRCDELQRTLDKAQRELDRQVARAEAYLNRIRELEDVERDCVRKHALSSCYRERIKNLESERADLYKAIKKLEEFHSAVKNLAAVDVPQRRGWGSCQTNDLR